MRAQRISRFLHTVRFLTLRQIVYRLKYSSMNRVSRKTLSFSGVSSDTGNKLKALQPIAAWLPGKIIDAAQVSKGTFQFLNHRDAFPNGIQWSAPRRDRLWNYNLHYFDYLLADGGLDPETAESLIADWIRHNPAGAPDAWDPFPISLRIVNLLKYASLANGNLSETAVFSVQNQCLWLERFIEYHLLGNHLLKNGKALIFSGLAFSGRDAARWLGKGLRITAKQVDEQVLPDGGHFERSPMYHAMILEDVLDLLNILPEGRPDCRALRSMLTDAAERMVPFLTAMTHPDDGIALFNDAAMGIEHTAADLNAYYSAVTGRPAPGQKASRLTAFPDTGYFVMAPRAGDKLIIDCGAIGPDYQPGHAHCDTLSFELSLRVQRVIVDSGCCQYEDAPIRQYNRGNAGHNTVTIDGENQSEVWGAHRCARRAYPLSAELREEPDGSLVFAGSHDGYRRLPGKPVHQRRVHWQKDAIDITDRIEGSGHHVIVSALHIHPDLVVTDKSDGLLVSGPDGPIVRILSKGENPIRVEKGWYCPEFGRQMDCPRLTVAFETTLPVRFGWRIAFH